MQLISLFTPWVEVIRNDDAELLNKSHFTHLVISPGPKDPSDSGLCKDLIERWRHTKPILGVCLGHQILGEAYGAKIIKAAYPIHGKVSEITHDKSEIFKGIPQSFKVARYHSLVIDPHSLPPCFKISANYGNMIMAISHKINSCLYGLQFHPESFLTEWGECIMSNFLNMTYHKVDCYE